MNNNSSIEEIKTSIGNLVVTNQKYDSVSGEGPNEIINAIIKENPEVQLFLTLSRSYDRFGQATEFTTSTINSTLGVYNNFISLTPTYDENNRLIQITKNRKSIINGTETNSVDFYNQYLYPPQSNNNIKEYAQKLTITNPPIKKTTASHNNDDQLEQLKGSINRKYAYTENGELKSMTNCYGTVNYEYDSFGNLKKVTMPNGKIIEYKVDGFNRRIKKLINGKVEEYYLWYDQTRLAAILDANKQTKIVYIYGPESNHTPSFVVKEEHTYKIIHDPGTGSVRYVVDPINTLIMQEIEYDEYGNMMKNTNPEFQPVGYTGGMYDADTKFIKLGARDYDPTIGRWTTKDPIGFNGGDTNLYAYVGGDPMSAIDPDGLKTTLVVTRDFGFATHTALHLTNNGNSVLYDPSGSYLNSRRGSGDTFGDNDADLGNFIKYHTNMGSTVETVIFNTTADQEALIANQISSFGGGGAFGCANSVSNVLGLCGISPTRFPSNLANQAKKAGGVCSSGK